MLRLLHRLPTTNYLRKGKLSSTAVKYAVNRPILFCPHGPRQRRFISIQTRHSHNKQEKSKTETKSKGRNSTKIVAEKEQNVKYMTVEQYELEAAKPKKKTSNLLTELFSIHKLKYASLLGHLQPNSTRPYGSVNNQVFPALPVPTNEILNYYQLKNPTKTVREKKEIVIGDDLLPKKVSSAKSVEDTASLNSTAVTNFKRNYSQSHQKKVAKIEVETDSIENETVKEPEQIYVAAPVKSYSDFVRNKKQEQQSTVNYPSRISYNLNSKSNLFSSHHKRNLHFLARQFSTLSSRNFSKRPGLLQPVRHTSNTQIPGFPEIKPLCEEVKCPKKRLKPADCTQFQRSRVIECDHYERVDKEQHVQRKRLPVLKPSDCPCVDPFIPSKSPKLKRLKMHFRDVPRGSCEKIHTCQRADDCLPPVVKKLKPYEPGLCPCIEPPPLVDVPLPRLKMECEELPPVTEKLCEDHYRADNGCWEFAIDDCPPELEEKKHPCPKVPTPPKCIPVGCKRFHTATFGNQCSIAKKSSLFANSGLMAKSNVLSQRRYFQIPSSDGKCNMIPPDNTKKKRRGKKGEKPCKLDSTCPKFKLDGCEDPNAEGCANKRTLVCCTKVSSPYPAFSEKIHEELLPYTKRLQWRCGKRAFPVYPQKLNEPLDKIRMMGYCTFARFNQGLTQRRVFSTATNKPSKNACEKDVVTCQEYIEKTRKCRSKELNEKCPIWCLPNCPPKAKRPVDCRDPKPKKGPCFRMKTPYRSFSDKCREAEIEQVYSECPISREKVRYLQPNEQNSEKLVFFGEPGPKVKIDPMVEENCIRQRFCIENKGLSQTCTTFGDNMKPLRSRDFIKVIDKDCKEIEKRKERFGTRSYSTWSRAINSRRPTDSLNINNLPPSLLANELIRNLLIPKSNNIESNRNMSTDAPRLRIFNKFNKIQKRQVRFLSTDHRKYKSKLSLNAYCDNERQKRKILCAKSLNERCAQAIKCKTEKQNQRHNQTSCQETNCPQCNNQNEAEVKGSKKANIELDDQCIESICKNRCPKIPSGFSKDMKDPLKKPSYMENLKQSSSQLTVNSILKTIVNFFKARPGCPTAEELRQQRLVEKAEKAAQKAGLCVYDPKKNCLCPVQKPDKECSREYSTCRFLIQKRYYSSYKKDLEQFIQLVSNEEDVEEKNEPTQKKVVIILKQGVDFPEGKQPFIDIIDSKFGCFKVLDKLTINEFGDLLLDSKNFIQTDSENNNESIYYDCKFVDSNKEYFFHPERAENDNLLTILQNIFAPNEGNDKKT